MAESEPKKGFVWYSLRISFWIIVLSIIVTEIPRIIGTNSHTLVLLSLIFSWTLLILTPFNFAISIIHLKKYKEKPFAITSLVISSITIILYILMTVYIFKLFSEAF